MNSERAEQADTQLFVELCKYDRVGNLLSEKRDSNLLGYVWLASDEEFLRQISGEKDWAILTRNTSINTPKAG